MTTEKENILKDIFECIEEAMELDSGDSDKEEILIRLTNLWERATCLRSHKKTMDETLEEVPKEPKLFAVFRKLITLSDEVSYKNYLRMTKEQFKYILNLIEKYITRADTVMRDAITPA